MASNIPVIVQGNSFSLAIPLQIYYINGDQMDLQDYTPDPTDEVSVQLKGSRRNYTYTPTIDGNIANIGLTGNELADNYSVVVSVVKADGQRLRSFRTDQFFIVESSDDLTQADIIEGLEENVIYLNTSIFVAGADGRGIVSIVKTSTSGLVDTYTITYTDNTTSTFNVTNGAQGEAGSSIASIAKTGTSGLVDTYTITLTDGSTTTFEVTNGMNGVDLGLANIVNDLTTGGATNVLSAEMGKVLGTPTITTQEVITDVPLTMHTESNTNGYYNTTISGTWVSDNTRRGSEKIDVSEGEKYLVTTKIGGSTAIAYLGQWNGTTWVGVATGFTGGSGDAVNKEYIVPSGVTKIAICSYNTTAPTLKKVSTVYVPTFYNKEQVDAKIANNKTYGVKWSTTDFDDLGTRVFDAVGKTATIGVGSTNGSSDFDSIYPWSEMKRCNIKINSNGAKIVTFEGETGFALDGTNGDVFVRIPKFKTNHYVDNGYEYLVIGEGYTHPAFVEDGVELDEIFIGAFEASKVGSALYSKAGDLPANNMTGAEFLTAAQARGTNYSLYDMRCVDALWRLMAVEYGCRNSNRILGYGYADYVQPVATSPTCVVTQASTSTNTVVGRTVSSASNAVIFQTCFAAGNVITICDTTQQNIIAQRKITAVSAVNGQALSVTFDGEPIDVTTSMFFGNGGIYTNYCESITSINASYALSWHTGRANRPVVAGSGMDISAINPCRYRWVENPVGNLWHALPDITFVDRQMYVCTSMKDYEFLKHTAPYYPVGAVLPLQNSNGNKLDVNTSANPNYWVTTLFNDIFSKGNNFGKTFDTTHDGSITSKKGFGGYYYLYNGIVYINNGGGFDHLWRCNMLTNRAWTSATNKWYLCGARLMYKNIDILAEAE